MTEGKNIKVRAQDNESFGTYTLIAIIIPIAGLILGILMLAKDTPIDKKLGEHLVAISILMGIVISVLWYAYMGSVYSPPTTYYTY